MEQVFKMTEKIQKIEIYVDPYKLIVSTIIVALWWNISNIFITLLERIIDKVPT